MVNNDDGDEILERMMAEGDVNVRAELANGLLRSMFRGYPIEHLRVLLASENQELVRSGAFVMSELGIRAQALKDELPRLLRSQDAHVRNYAIDSVLTCCTGENGSTIAMVIACLDDPHRGVRIKATDFLSRASREQLQGALRALEVGAVSLDPVKENALAWLLSSVSGAASGVRDALASDSDIMRKVGLAAADRIAGADLTALQLAVESDDEEIREMAIRRLREREEG